MQFCQLGLMAKTITQLSVDAKNNLNLIELESNE